MYLILAPFVLALILQTTFAELIVTVRINDSTPAFISLSIQNNKEFMVGLLHFNTPLDQRFGGLNTFSVYKDGQPVPYIGAMVKYAEPSLQDYTLLGANETITVQIALNRLYDLSQPGTYAVQFDSYFMDYINVLDFSIPRLRENFTPSERITSNIITIDLLSPVPPPLRAVYPCSTSEKQIITTAANAQITLIGYALSEINRQNTASYVEWFGTYTQQRWQIAEEVIRLVSQNRVARYECDDQANVYAYVYPVDQSHTIYLCSAFWPSKVIGGFDTQAGTLIHELSHFNDIGATDDWVYGTTGARQLARTTPARAVNNADNFEYFSESQY
jgi:peptidyl-Lys metalloendopeptidase